MLLPYLTLYTPECDTNQYTQYCQFSTTLVHFRKTISKTELTTLLIRSRKLYYKNIVKG